MPVPSLAAAHHPPRPCYTDGVMPSRRRGGAGWHGGRFYLRSSDGSRKRHAADRVTAVTNRLSEARQGASVSAAGHSGEQKSSTGPIARRNPWQQTQKDLPMTASLSFKTFDDQADPTFNQLLGINNDGKIAGYFGSGTPASTHPNKGYTLTIHNGQPQFTNENFLGSQQTQVTGINNHGTTVGFWADAAGDNFGFVNKNGVFADVVDPAGKGKAANGMTTEQLLGVNDQDKAVGFWTDAAGNNHGFTFNINSNHFSEFDIAGFASTTTTAINNKGDIAGFVAGADGNDVSFVQEGKNLVWLNGPTGSVSVQALGINNERQVVGSYVDGQGATHGFLFDQSKNTYTTIDDPNGVKGQNAMTVANGINDKGQVVGFYLDAAGNTDGMLVQVHHS
jgi:uncharacterized membrane protein